MGKVGAHSPSQGTSFLASTLTTLVDASTLHTRLDTGSLGIRVSYWVLGHI